jgi:hypothetical protein
MSPRIIVIDGCRLSSTALNAAFDEVLTIRREVAMPTFPFGYAPYPGPQTQNNDMRIFTAKKLGRKRK